MAFFESVVDHDDFIFRITELQQRANGSQSAASCVCRDQNTDLRPEARIAARQAFQLHVPAGIAASGRWRNEVQHQVCGGQAGKLEQEQPFGN